MQLSSGHSSMDVEARNPLPETDQMKYNNMLNWTVLFLEFYLTACCFPNVPYSILSRSLCMMLPLPEKPVFLLPPPLFAYLPLSTYKFHWDFWDTFSEPTKLGLVSLLSAPTATSANTP